MTEEDLDEIMSVVEDAVESVVEDKFVDLADELRDVVDDAETMENINNAYNKIVSSEIRNQMNPEKVTKTGHDYAAVLKKKIDVMEY